MADPIPAGDPGRVSRRGFMRAAGLTAGAGSAALIAACGSQPGTPSEDASDVRHLNQFRSLQLSAASFYTQIAPKLKGSAAASAQVFASRAKTQADALLTPIDDLGGTPVQPKSEGAYAQELGLAAIKDQAAALQVAVSMEDKAIGFYLAAVPKVFNDDVRGAAGQLLTASAEQVAVLLGLQTGNDPARQVPSAFVRGPTAAFTREGTTTGTRTVTVPK